MFAGETRYRSALSPCFRTHSGTSTKVELLCFGPSTMMEYKTLAITLALTTGTGTRNESHEAYAGLFLPRGSHPGSGHRRCGYLGCGCTLTLWIRNAAFEEDATLLQHATRNGRAHGSCLQLCLLLVPSSDFCLLASTDSLSTAPIGVDCTFRTPSLYESWRCRNYLTFCAVPSP